MNPFERKAIYLWDAPSVGDPAKIVSLLRGAGFESVYLHASYLNEWRTLHSRALVEALHAGGIAVAGSAAVYGIDGIADGIASANLCLEYRLDGWTFDIEGKYEARAGAVDTTRRMLGAFRQVAPALPLGWCSWARFNNPAFPYGPWHPVAVMAAAMPYCDYGLPMAYWTDAPTAAAAVKILEQSLAQWGKQTDKPIVPVGRAYHGDGTTATPEAVKAFAKAAAESGCPGISWWSMQHALKLPTIWAALAETPGVAVKVESQLDRIERKLDELLEMAKV